MSQQRPRTVVRRPNAARRAAAPQRRRLGAVPAFTFAASTGALTLAVALGLASFAGENVTAGEAGPNLARLVAAAAGAAGVFGVLASLLLVGEGTPRDQLLIPAVVGIVVGALQALALFLVVSPWLLVAPWLLLIMALPFVWAPARRRRRR